MLKEVNGKIYILPKDLPDITDCGVIRAGILAGEVKKNRVEPEHALFTASDPQNLRRILNLKLSDKRTEEFLSGKEIYCDTKNGYTAVAFEGIISGFGKCSDGRLKNKYPKGLRIYR